MAGETRAGRSRSMLMTRPAQRSVMDLPSQKREPYELALKTAGTRREVPISEKYSCRGRVRCPTQSPLNSTWQGLIRLRPRLTTWSNGRSFGGAILRGPPRLCGARARPLPRARPQGRGGTDTEPAQRAGRGSALPRHTAHHPRRRHRASPTPLERAQEIAARPGGPAHLVPLERRDPGQPRDLPRPGEPRARGRGPGNVHASTIDGLVLAGLVPKSVAPS